MRKNPHAVALGRLGGKATAEKPVTRKQKIARRRNMALAREAQLETAQHCAICRGPIIARNRSGICRHCQRHETN